MLYALGQPFLPWQTMLVCSVVHNLHTFIASLEVSVKCSCTRCRRILRALKSSNSILYSWIGDFNSPSRILTICKYLLWCVSLPDSMPVKCGESHIWNYSWYNIPPVTQQLYHTYILQMNTNRHLRGLLILSTDMLEQWLSLSRSHACALQIAMPAQYCRAGRQWPHVWRPSNPFHFPRRKCLRGFWLLRFGPKLAELV